MTSGFNITSNIIPKNEALIEIKYIKKENYREEELNKKKSEGIEQINRYKLSEELREKKQFNKIFTYFCW